MSVFAQLPEPPYYAVIFSSQRPGLDDGYGDMADRMVELSSASEGFLGIESTRDADGFGITVCYWQALADIARWKANAEHQLAQQLGYAGWYQHFELRIAKVERAYSMR